MSPVKKPEWMSEAGKDTVDSDLDASLVELYGALDNDLNMLAAIGIRTSFDIAAGLLGIDQEMPFKKRRPVFDRLVIFNSFSVWTAIVL
jgi:hypothetical protein